MSFFFKTVKITSKRLFLRRGSIFITALLMVLTGVLCAFFAKGQEALEVRVGMVVGAGDEFGHAILSRMQSYGSPVKFELYDPGELAEVERLVTIGKMECAYVLAPDFRQGIVRGRANGGVELLRSPRSVLHTLTNEMLFAAVLAEKAPDMAVELIADILGLSLEDAWRHTNERFEYYAGADVFLTPEFSYVNHNRAESDPPPPGVRVLRAAIALTLLGCVIWAVPPFIPETPGLLNRMPGATSRVYLFGVALGITICQMLTGALALAVIQIIYPTALGGVAAEVLWLLAYCLALGFGGAGAILIFRRGDFIYGGGIFLLLLCALLGGALADLNELGELPGLASRFFITSGYISGGAHGAEVIIITIIVGVILCLRPRVWNSAQNLGTPSQTLQTF